MKTPSARWLPTPGNRWNRLRKPISSSLSRTIPPNAIYGQRIEFDYKSYLMLTGEPYDQTYGKRPPILHVVGEPMFPGLIHAFQLMNAGSIYRFYFPYQLAFGPTGASGIPGYTPFIYEIELHKTFND